MTSALPGPVASGDQTVEDPYSVIEESINPENPNSREGVRIPDLKKREPGLIRFNFRLVLLTPILSFRMENVQLKL